jgi:outer membrane protein OmpA-like peptidoglycan-associated protein
MTYLLRRRWLLGVGFLLILSACESGPPIRKNESASVIYEKFVIYSSVNPTHDHYVPSGYMGDSNMILSGAYVPTHDGSGPCLRVNYRPSGAMGWSGVYWQQPANNWADIPGNAGYDLRGASRLTFWARGDKGGEKIHEFRIGGIVGRYPDSDAASIGPITLSQDWKRYEIDVSDKDLRHIIGGFGLFVNKYDAPNGMVFYLDDIAYDLPKNVPAPPMVVKAVTPTSPTAPLTGASPTLHEEQIAPGVVVVRSGPPKTSNTSIAAPAVSPAVAPSSPPSKTSGLYEQQVAPGVVVVRSNGSTAAKENLAPPSSKGLEFKSEDAGLRVSFSSQFLFASGETTLRPESRNLLGQVTNTLKAYPKNDVLIEGHTDKSGNSDYNLKLSRLRAENVRDYLIKEGGFDAQRFRVVGYGDTRPVADNSTAGGRTLNRRVELIILKVPEK